MAMPFTVYILASETSGGLYIGQTNNLDRRLGEHANGQTRSTRGRGPWTLISAEHFPTRKAAVRHERWLKSLKSPSYILDYIHSR